MNNNTDTKEEIKYFAKRALLIDVGVYLVWSLISGFGTSMLFGLLLGTVAIILDMFITQADTYGSGTFKVQGSGKRQDNVQFRCQNACVKSVYYCRIFTETNTPARSISSYGVSEDNLHNRRT